MINSERGMSFCYSKIKMLPDRVCWNKVSFDWDCLLYLRKIKTITSLWCWNTVSVSTFAHAIEVLRSINVNAPSVTPFDSSSVECVAWLALMDWGWVVGWVTIAEIIHRISPTKHCHHGHFYSLVILWNEHHFMVLCNSSAFSTCHMLSLFLITWIYVSWSCISYKYICICISTKTSEECQMAKNIFGYYVYLIY